MTETPISLIGENREKVTFSSEIDVKLIRSTASDDGVIQAAQVSVKGENNPNTVPERLISTLMSHRHGTPFEHNSMTFFIAAPIFVFREWHRHRIASINEMSGRYTVLKPRFYSVAPDRKMINIGTSMDPRMAPGTPEHYQLQIAGDEIVCQLAWDVYKSRLEAGISNELARTILPLNIYSEMYWTVNARSLMNFLSLRVDSPDSRVHSSPQWEIQMGAEKIEAIFAELMPVTHDAFVRDGRVAP